MRIRTLSDGHCKVTGQEVGVVLWDFEYHFSRLGPKRFKSCNGLLSKDPVFRPIEKGWDYMYTGVE